MFRSGRVLVSDGAWGTEMVRLGLRPGECPELWNLQRPDDVLSIARAYSACGVDIILTNTFGGSCCKLRRFGLQNRVRDINRRGVEISRQAAGCRKVFASIGPTGEFARPVGALSEEDLLGCFFEQVHALEEVGVDGVVIETMTDLTEARCALRAVLATGIRPAGVCLSFGRGPRGFATIMGITPEQAGAELAASGADFVGANCGSVTAGDMVEILKQFRKATDLPLWVKPNAGIPVLKAGRTIYPDSPASMAEAVPALIEAGAAVVGGCCGTTPKHVRAIFEAAHRYRR